MLTIPIAVINASTLISPAELVAVTAAIQVQVRRDFSPAWSVDADLAVVKPGEDPPTGAWWVAILDNSDAGSTLGYHDLTTEGQPLAKVFVGPAKQAGQAWTTVFSHDVLEMLADPYICLTALTTSGAGWLLYPYENCDACQSDSYGYLIGDHLVSDFVYPTWFDPRESFGTRKFDYGKHITRPFELLPGGFSLILDLSFGSGWHLITGPGTAPTYHMRPRVGSRRERRRTCYVNWLKSAVAIGREFRAAELVRPSM